MATEKHKTLHREAAEGNLEVVRRLLAEGVDPNIPNIMGRVALHWAAAKGHVAVVQALLDAGADPSILNGDQKTALDLATEHKRGKVVELLSNVMQQAIQPSDAKRSDESVTANLASAALEVAAPAVQQNVTQAGGKSSDKEHEILQQVKAAIAGKVDLDAPTGFWKAPLLHQAVLAGSLSAVKQLVDAGASVNVTALLKRTPLHWAALALANEEGKKAKNQEIAGFLISVGANVNAVDDYGKTPCDSAMQKKNWEMARLLMDAGANSQQAPLTQASAQRGVPSLTEKNISLTS